MPELAVAGGASAASVIAAAGPALRPPRRLKLSEWADQHFHLSAESAAEPGRWKTIPYQRGIMDSITDPAVEQVSVMKSARVGYTKIIDAAVGYYVHQDPCPIMVVQPTVEDAEGYSKEELAPMFRDSPALAAVMPDPSARDSKNTILHKIFPGGSLSVVGANSGRGFRRVSRKVVIFDETDGYPPSAGSEGDQIKLGIRRTEYYWDRKIIAGSTPLVAGASRIADLFEAGDQRRYFVPCPSCGHMAPLVFSGDAGHAMKWPEGKPEEAAFSCQLNGCVIEHKDKRWMVERGEWRAAAPFRGHASFHIWAAYSYSPNASWGQLAAEFLEAKKAGPEKLKTFVNTVLGEVWVERGEAPEFQRLYQRREPYPRGVVPPGALLLTAGVDVQRDRLVWEVVGWGEDAQSWSVDQGVLMGDTSGEEVWGKLEQEVLHRDWLTAGGAAMRLQILAVDSGFNTQNVYNWARRYPSRVMACKGVSTAKAIALQPTKVDVTIRGKRIARGCQVWPVGVDIVKAELYGRLRLEPPTKESGEPFPPGYCHFPEYGEDFFKQLTAEHLVSRVTKQGFVVMEWQVIPGRENHNLDARVYARAAAFVAGLDRAVASKRARAAAPPPAPREPPDAPHPSEEEPMAQKPEARRAGWLGSSGRGRSGGRGNWLGRTRR